MSPLINLLKNEESSFKTFDPLINLSPSFKIEIPFILKILFILSK